LLIILTIVEPIHKVFYNKSSGSSKYLQDQKEDNVIYVQDWGKHVVHSINCVDLINCTCTPLEVSTKLEERRKQWWVDNHKQIKERERLRRKQGSDGQQQRDFFDPTMPREDLGE
jgi:hypothetical protein